MSGLASRSDNRITIGVARCGCYVSDVEPPHPGLLAEARALIPRGPSTHDLYDGLIHVVVLGGCLYQRSRGDDS